MPAAEAVDARRVARVARCFDTGIRLQRWPTRRGDQIVVLWVLWSLLPGDRQLDEAEVNAMLRDWNDFGDYILLRRELVDFDLLRRTPDGGIYRRVAHSSLPAEAEAVLARLEAV